ncbi:MAG: hypothetical protein NC548_44925 [Lachnospiraceae bacterium]|nr:hypothetical protein [Lachnospiraceae bacterium]MCM1232194.1 hypothetical protein [Ruminococcus flavefaciens]
MESNYSLADIRAATHDNDNDGWDNGGGGWFWIVVLFLFMFGFGGNGMWGNNGNMQGALTRSDLCEGFNFQNIENGIRGIQQGLCDGFYAMNTTMLQGMNGLGTQILENRFASKECCCETNRNIDAVRYDAQKNTCDITTAIHSEGEQTRALINQNTMQALRDKLEDRDRELQSAKFQISQMGQTSQIVGALTPPRSVPAYLTCSPYENSFLAQMQMAAQLLGLGNNGCGCNNCA